MRRPLYWACMLVVILLVGLNIVAAPVLQPDADRSLPIHKTLYLDRTFSDAEVGFITEAALDWHYQSYGLVTFDVVKMPAKSIDMDDAIFITIVTEDYPEIVGLDSAAPEAFHLGYFDHVHGIPYIALVPYRIHPDVYRAVVMHELGHSLGLKHNEGIEGVGSLMYPSVDLGADQVTEMDLNNLCKLYDCDPKKLHH